MTAFVFKYRHHCCVIGSRRKGEPKKRDMKPVCGTRKGRDKSTAESADNPHNIMLFLFMSVKNHYKYKEIFSTFVRINLSGVLWRFF